MVYLWTPQTISDPDIWWHLRNAQYLFHTHKFIHQDSFSYTAFGQPWINHEWLSEVPFYLGWCLLKERGVLLVSVAAIELILLGVFFLAYQRSKNIAGTILASLFCATCATVSFGPRTLLFGWVCLVAELIILQKIPSRGSWMWALPPLFVLWINLHGSWIIGLYVFVSFVLCGYFSAERRSPQTKAYSEKLSRRLLLCVGVTTSGLLVNPYGWRLIAYPFDLAYKQVLNISTIEEWQTLNFHSVRAKIFLLAIALLFSLSILLKTEWSLHEAVQVLTGIYAAVTYSRFLFLAGILMAPIAAMILSPLIPSKPVRRALLPSFLIILVSSAVLFERFRGRSLSIAQAAPPFGAVHFIESTAPQGKIFNDFRWGGFLEWNLRSVPTFIDSRVDIFEYDGTLQNYLDIVSIKEPLELLDKYNIGYVLFTRDTPLSYLLEHSQGWRLAYQDGTTDLFERMPIRKAAEVLRP